MSECDGSMRSSGLMSRCTRNEEGRLGCDREGGGRRIRWWWECGRGGESEDC